MMNEKKIDGRRRFLFAAAGAAPALAVAAVLSKKEQGAGAAAPEAGQAQSSGVGYHETDHIRKYYFTAGYF